MEKLKEIRFLVLDQMKMIKELQVYIWLVMAMNKRSQLRRTLSNARSKIGRPWESYKIKPFQLNSHNFNKQKYWVEEIFAKLKSLPPPHSPDYIHLMQRSGTLYVKHLKKIGYMCYKIFGLCP